LSPTTEQDALVNRTQMVKIAREFNLFVSKGTIHRWANEADFPLAVGKEGKYLLYYLDDFVRFLKQRLRKIQEEH